MSSQNAYPGPLAGRLGQRPANQAANPQDRQTQPAWAPQAPAPRQPQQPNWPQQQTGNYAQPAPIHQPVHQAASQQPAYDQWSDYQHAAPQGYGAPAADPYAPQFEPYTPPAPAYAQQPPASNGGYGAQPPPPAAPQWAGLPQQPNPGAGHGYQAAPYSPPAPQVRAPQQRPAQPVAHQADHQFQDVDFGGGDWHHQQMGNGYGHAQHDPYQQPQHGSDLGFAQPSGGELEPAYDEEDGEYEYEEAPRSRRPIMILAALAGAIIVGGGFAYGFKKFSSGDADGAPPTIKSASLPAKTKPADAGGKQFPYSDSKIMGRLGDGSSSDSASSPSGSPAAAAASADDGGARKVSTLVVGRDGSIQAPPDQQRPSGLGTSAKGDVAVPGLTLVDAFGNQQEQAAPPPPGPQANFKKVIVQPPSAQAADVDPPVSNKKVASLGISKINGSDANTKKSSETTGSIRDSEETSAPPPAKKLKKVAKASTSDWDPDAAASPTTSSSSGGSGYVAVLASVPRSSSSRMDALKQFADMQQRYGDVLAGKTPDVAEANLGNKGSYHRLIVGPPGSRDKASSICSKLKAQGYADCWVTAY